MGSGVKIKVHSPGMTTNLLVKLYEAKTLPILAEQILSDCNTYVRMQDGTLADSAHQENGGKHIVWSTAYAKRVYYTGTPRKNRNPLASLRWCEVAKRTHSRSWAALASKLVGGG